MNDLGKVQGDKLIEIFRYLIERRIIIGMHMVGTDLERLTCVTQIAEGPQPSFSVDLPQDFKVTAQSASQLKLRFNFNGPDRLEYIFGTQGGQVNGRSLHLPLPDYVERLQRRRDFRMDTPIGTKLFIKMDKLHAVLGLINISLGGLFGTLLKHNRKDLNGSLFDENQTIVNAGILFPASDDMDEHLVIIKKSDVRRIEHDVQRKIYKYALQFMDIDPGEKKKLTQAIYAIQRQFLQRR